MPLRRIADVRLGKMLQSTPSLPTDREVPYLRAGSLNSLDSIEGLPTMYASPSDLVSYTVRGGDLVITEGGDIGRAAFVPEVPPHTIIQNSLHRVRSKCADLRFLKYAIDWIYNTGWLDVLCNRSTFGHLTSEKIAALPIPCPSIKTQRAISKFLDVELARIDKLVIKKRRMIGLLEERRSGLIESLIRQVVTSNGEAPLRFFAHEITVGIVVTPSAWYADEGVPALRGVNVSPGNVDLDELVYLTSEGHELHRKSKLRVGDVVVVRTGQAGAAAVVPPALEDANCIDLIIIRAGPRLDSRFLEYVLNSDWTQKHVDQHSVGSIQNHFNVAAMKSIPIPSASRDVQRAIVDRLDDVTSHLDYIAKCLQRQISLLKERRDALITVAVTGQLDIPGVRHETG